MYASANRANRERESSQQGPQTGPTRVREMRRNRLYSIAGFREVPHALAMRHRPPVLSQHSDLPDTENSVITRITRNAVTRGRRSGGLTVMAVSRTITDRCGQSRRKTIALALVFAVAIPGLIIVQMGGSSNEDRPTAGIQGGASSGWINDVQAYGGGGHDLWPTMVSIGDSVYVAFSTFDSGTGYYKITVLESTDGGIVWSPIGDLSPGSGDCRYPVMTFYNGSLFIAFQYDSSSTDRDIYCYKSSAGATGPWTAFAVRADANDDFLPTIGAVTVTNHAGVYVVFENRRGGLDGTDLLIYGSAGDAFSPLGTLVGAGDPDEFTNADMSVYQDETNQIIYIAYQRLTGGQSDIYFVRSLNGGVSWSSPYQVAASPNDEYAPSISVGFFYLLISYVMWDGDPDLYATVWNGVAFGTPYPLSSSPDFEGWPRAYNWLDDFYVVYARGSNYTNGNLFIQSASGSLNPYWSMPFAVSDPEAAANTTYRPGLALCDRPDSNFYFAVTWGDYRTGSDNSDLYYSTQGCRYTVRTDPPGLTFQVDDVTYSSEQTFNWPAGYRHKLTATDSSLPFYCWDDGTYQWYTPTINPFASTNDVTPGMTAVYTAIPEFPGMALPVIALMFVILISVVRRKNE